MQYTPPHLLHSRRFLPLFITQFIGALVDNLFKNALVALLLFGMNDFSAQDPKLLVTLAAGFFITPFIMFSALGGQLAKKYDKALVFRQLQLAEIFIACFGSFAILYGSIELSLFTLFLLGTHSALFSPSKYSFLPQSLATSELISGNALLNMGTFLAILIGTISGTSLTLLPEYGKMIICCVLVTISILGWLASRAIPSAPSTHILQINFNLFSQTKKTIVHLFAQPREIVLSVLGVSWFYFLGAMFLSQFPNYTKEFLKADQYVLVFFLTIFSVGIAIGSLLNNRLLRGKVEATYVPLAILGISVFAIDLYFASNSVSILDSSNLMTIYTFISTLSSWRIVVDIFLIAVLGGVFVVPLNAIIQSRCQEDVRAEIMAGSSICDAIFMVSSSILSAVLILSGLTIAQLFLFFALANVIVAIYICRLLPEYLFKSILQIIFVTLYKVEIRGIENIAKAGPRAIIVGNHVSLLDAPILAAFLPGKPMFAIDTQVAKWFWLKPFLRLVDVFPIDPANPFSIKSLIRKVQEDRHVVIFPEGRLTQTGALMKIYEGPGMVAHKAKAMILPIRLDGVQHSPFTYLKGRVPFRSFPKITITVLEPRYFNVDETLSPRNARHAAGRQLYDLMEQMMFITHDRQETLFQALLKARYVNGNNAVILEDVRREPMKFKHLIQASIVLGKKIEEKTVKGENVGILMPNISGTVVTFFALQAYGRVPTMLNYSAGNAAVSSACTIAAVKIVVTSKQFIEVARLQAMVAKLAETTNIVYLEDLRAQISWRDKLAVIFTSASRTHKKLMINSNDPAVILFTSGSEGSPKGVVLSHTNIMANIVQISCRVDFNRQDILFNCLPIFHSFGLTGGMLLPVLCGIRLFLYPTPLHYRIVPEFIYSTNATIMFGTDTFLRGYAALANPYDFYRMRYIFAGAEKVREETRLLYMDKFGVRVFEGYGATETSPVLAVNSPLHNKSGTVGRFLSGINYRLDPVPGVDNGGRLLVQGPNIMLGYYLVNAPGVLQPTVDSWYDTGDIVTVDQDGFVKIVGRVKRFAKIAGEMVSLSAVEDLINILSPSSQHAAICLPDLRRGEKIIVVTTANNMDLSAISSLASQIGVSALHVPQHLFVIPAMPVLGTGKVDYVTVQKYVNDQLNSN